MPLLTTLRPPHTTASRRALVLASTLALAGAFALAGPLPAQALNVPPGWAPRDGMPPQPNGMPQRPGTVGDQQRPGGLRTSQLPPAQPTQLAQPAQMPLGAATATPIPASAPAAQLADVTFSHGLLEVRADNSSLHQILRSIVRLTGMTLQGSVLDQRVFGSYGPEPASTVLATLLDGTGVNILLKSSPRHVPLSLVLTPQAGQPAGTPVDLSVQDSGPAVAPTAPTPAPMAAQPLAQPQPTTESAAPPAAQPATQAAPTSPAPATSTAAAASPAPATANGISSPEQIYQQLLKLRQQQAQPSPPASPSAPH